MNNLICQNVRGLNGPNKQKKIKILCNKQDAGLIGLLETKVNANKIDKLATNMFSGWTIITNLDTYYDGRVWIT